MKNEIIIYRPNEAAEHIEVRLENETFWLNQTQMSILFGQTKQNISLHISNCFNEGELDQFSTVKKYLIVRIKNKRSDKPCLVKIVEVLLINLKNIISLTG